MVQRAVLLLALFLCLCGVYLGREDDELPVSEEVRRVATALYHEGKMSELISYLDEVERSYTTLILDSEHPSLYAYRGVALYNAQRMVDAEKNFLKAVSHTPWDTRSWINIGELRIQTFNINGAIMAFGQAYKQHDMNALGHLLRAKGWAADWRDFERISSVMERNAIKCTNASNNRAALDQIDIDTACQGVDGSAGMEYTFLGGEHGKVLHALSPNARNVASPQAEKLSSSQVPDVASRSTETDSVGKRLKVGIVSSDFGVHPVSSLVRGAIHMIDRSKIELFCFSLQDKYSWWGANISSSAEHFIYLSQVNTLDAAKEVAKRGIEILIDLNGHTMFSGLRLMAHRPAPIQFSFLGLPTTTGSSFIDYYLGDRVALPPEHGSHFTESVSLLPECYIVNDYAQLQGDLVQYLDGQRAPRADLVGEEEQERVEQAPMLFATLSNTQKLDPSTWHVWMNLMRTFAGCKMVHVHHRGSGEALPHMKRTAVMHGIAAEDVVMAGQTPWIDHLYSKTAVDMILDTGAKNGHTTGLDGLWAGVPTASFAGGTTMSTRAAESIQTSLGVGLGLAYSKKDYEDTVRRVLQRMPRDESAEEDESLQSHSEDARQQHVQMQQQQRRLRVWKDAVGEGRTSGPLFDTPGWTRDFERQLQVTWDVALLQSPSKRKFQIVLSKGGGEGKVSRGHDADAAKAEGGALVGRLRLNQAYTPQSKYFPAEVGRERRGDGFLYVDGNGDTAAAPAAPATPAAPAAPSSASARSGLNALRDEHRKSRARLPEPLEPLPAGLLDRDYIFLNIGGTTFKEGWYNVNSQRGIGLSEGRREADVDVVRLMDHLEGIPDGAVGAVYASHTLEHASFGDGHLEDTLEEWRRVLRPGGLLLISVPDLRTIFQLYLQAGLSAQEKWTLTMMIYGAQSDEYDYHKVGFDESILTTFLRQAGFCGIERTGSFNLFNDTSETAVKGVPISLNVAAYKCKSPAVAAQDGFRVNHQADPYVPPPGHDFPQEHLCEACKLKEDG